ncbi:MAG: amidohydrolase family protein [Candidatus Limnocylindrales bacterium]
MSARRLGLAPLSAILIMLALTTGCQPGTIAPPASSAPSNPPASSATASPATQDGNLVILGRILTMDEPAVAEALLIEGGIVAAVGTSDDVMAMASDQVPVIDIGQNVAYPGFIDAHAHWIGDRNYYDLKTPAEAMEAAITRGWTSISEQWVNPAKLDELTGLAADETMPLRVDAYLALNFGGEFFGDWYEGEERGPVGGRFRVQGLKIHLDNGASTIVNWEPTDVTETIGRADAAGWQVSVHAVSTDAIEMVLDAYEAALGPSGLNPLHHRIEHAIQVSDDQLARMVAMDLAAVIHLDGTAGDWLTWSEYLGHGSPDALEGGTRWLTRWRAFVDAGLHVAAATDTPWFLPESVLTDDISRPMDQIAGGMDERGRTVPETPVWMQDQLLTAEQGLRAVTVDAAYALGDETRRGHLAPGTLGDVTILSGDVTAGTPDEIRAMTVIATIVGGVPVYCADVEIC